MPGEMLVDFQVHLGALPHHDAAKAVKVDIRNVNFWYGAKQALKHINLKLHRREVTAFIGPSGCGKTMLLRCLNRSNEIIPGTRMEGTVLLDGEDIYLPDVDPPVIRRCFGWIAQKPNPFPSSIRSNVAYGAQLHNLVSGRSETDALVERCLTMAGLWDEVKDRLGDDAPGLSGGQQQRLCVARALATAPEILLMDEPASALDPRATAGLEALIDELRRDFTIVIVTHNLQQAARIAQRVAFFHLGNLVEQGDTDKVFVAPRERLTHDYVTGRFG